MAPSVQLSVVSPCYNEELVVEEFYRRMSAACEATQLEYEIILVNDGSRDKTAEIIDRLAAEDPHVVAVHLSRNHGHQLAMTAGLSLVRGEDVLVIDADLQDPPEILEGMIDKRRKGADVVYGVRRVRAGETWFKKATAHWFYRMLNSMTEANIPNDTGDFRLMSRRTVQWLLAMPERHRFVRGMVSWVGFRQEPILYDREARYMGDSKYPLRRMMRLAMDAITSFSVKPLTLAVYLSLISGSLSVVFIAYALISWISGHVVAGWSSLLIVISLLSCMQFLILGIQGQYLGRLYEEVKGRPLFIIDRVVSQQGSTEMMPPEAMSSSTFGNGPRSSVF